MWRFLEDRENISREEIATRYALPRTRPLGGRARLAGILSLQPSLLLTPKRYFFLAILGRRPFKVVSTTTFPDQDRRNKRRRQIRLALGIPDRIGAVPTTAFQIWKSQHAPHQAL
jgi:hypothetical protein